MQTQEHSRHRTLPQSEPNGVRDPHRLSIDPTAETDRLPVDRSRPFDPNDYPRDPTAYTPLLHVLGHYRYDEARLLDKQLGGRGEPIPTAIRDGELRDNGDGCGCFVFDWCGVYYYVVVGFHERGYRIIVSAWPVVRRREKAQDSGTWTAEELNLIEAFNEQHYQQSSAPAQRQRA